MKHPYFSRKKEQSAKGQSIVEYAGMIVLSTLMVGGMMGGTKQVMPVLFNALSYNNANALSDEPPAPASTLRAPAPVVKATHTRSPTPSPAPSPAPASPMKLTEDFSLPSVPQLALTQMNNLGKAPNQPAQMPAATASPAAGPSPAPAPNIAPGPSPAPPITMAPGPAPAPGPRVAPAPTISAPP